jgi:hypothetical protein
MDIGFYRTIPLMARRDSFSPIIDEVLYEFCWIVLSFKQILCAGMEPDVILHGDRSPLHTYSNGLIDHLRLRLTAPSEAPFVSSLGSGSCQLLYVLFLSLRALCRVYVDALIVHYEDQQVYCWAHKAEKNANYAI